MSNLVDSTIICFIYYIQNKTVDGLLLERIDKMQGSETHL